MPGSAAVERAGHITQLGFDSLAVVSANESNVLPAGKQAGIATATFDVATFGRPEVYRSAPQSRRRGKKHTAVSGIYNQSTFDDLFATTSLEADILSPLPITSIRGARNKKEQGHITQLGFDALAEVSVIDGSTIQAKKPAGSSTEHELEAVQQSDQLPAGRTEDALPGSLENSERTISSSRRRRVILDEPEPEVTTSRDFRITEEHGVGTGGLHEKATANIAAIRLLKTLEAENRDATDEEKATLVRYAGWGALAGVFEFDWRIKPEWKAAASELKQLLTEEEYESARATTPNSHFTSPLVITSIWDGLRKLGVGKGVEVLEPACGIGHF